MAVKTIPDFVKLVREHEDELIALNLVRRESDRVVRGTGFNGLLEVVQQSPGYFGALGEVAGRALVQQGLIKYGENVSEVTLGLIKEHPPIDDDLSRIEFAQGVIMGWDEEMNQQGDVVS